MEILVEFIIDNAIIEKHRCKEKLVPRDRTVLVPAKLQGSKRILARMQIWLEVLAKVPSSVITSVPLGPF